MEIQSTTSEFQRSFTPREPSAATSAELSAALRRDRAELQRGMLVWHRPLRLAAAGVIALVAMTFSHLPALPLARPLGLLAALYAALVWIVTQRAGAATLRAHYRWHAGTLVAADVLFAAAALHVSSPPTYAGRVLLLGLGIAALGVHYFGRAVGATAAVAALAAFVLTAAVLPPRVEGPRPSLLALALDAALFTVAVVPLIHALGRHRERLDRLRVFCALMTDAGRSASESLGRDTRPDELSLLARTLDALRGRFLAQIGTDPLTGCLTRRAFGVRLQGEWNLATRRGSALALLVIDLDHFKRINDTYGHPVGDNVLRDVARVMRHTKRESDVCARVGGDEFLMLLPDTPLEGAQRVATRIREQLAARRFGEPAASIPVTISVGVGVANGHETIEAETLFERADHALYRAKADGRNRIAS